MKLIPQDLCDTDTYKLSMSQAIFHQFPHATARYKYFNRAEDKKYPEGFADKVRVQVEMMSELKLTSEMFSSFLQKPWMKLSYLTWLKNYQYNPERVDIKQINGELDITIEGLWYEEIFWEVPLLYIISELKSKGQAKSLDWIDRIKHKTNLLSEEKVKWIDFGTRRRFDFETQNQVVNKMKESPAFQGTSNPYLAMIHGVEACGSIAHEFIMGMQSLFGVENCNRNAMNYWVKEYKNDLLVALTDTVTTEVFLKDFDRFYAELFDGVRIDSGNPFIRGDLIVDHYEKLGLNPKNKTIMFSDQLNCQLAIDLNKYFKGRIKTVMGIGTYLTNDVGARPPNHVIKLTRLNDKPVVKLSDGEGKFIGSDVLIESTRKLLRI